MTIEWIHPAALAGLAALAAPLLVHLLRLQHARRVPFPSLRFLTTSRAAAARMRAPGDPWLLLIRLAIVAAAAVAWAQPVLLTGAGRQRRERDVVRAVVIDTSASLSSSAAAAREAASAERHGAVGILEVPSQDVRGGLREAVRRLHDAALARREIVVLSDFPHGTLDGSDVARIPADIGVRFVPVRSTEGTLRDPQRLTPAFAGAIGFGGPGAPANIQTIELRDRRTGVTVTPDGQVQRAPRIIAAGDAHPDVKTLLRVVASAGAPAFSASRPVAIAFSGGALPGDVSLPRADWMLRALVTMRRDSELQKASARASAQAMVGAAVTSGDAERRTSGGAPWVEVVPDSSGKTVVGLAARGNELIARVAAQPSEYLAAVALRALLVATADSPSWSDREVETIPARQLQAWRPAPGSIPAERWQQSAPGDARWCWTLVLLLLGAETLVRRARRQAALPDEAMRAA